MVNIIIDETKIDLDENGNSVVIDEIIKNTNNKKEKKKPKIKPLEIVQKDIIKFGKYKGMKYEEMLSDDMNAYIKFIKRCHLRNKDMDDFVKWYDLNKPLIDLLNAVNHFAWAEPWT